MSASLLLVAQALAAPLMLRIADPEQRLRDPVRGVAEAGGVAAAFAPVDDGLPPDVLAGDGVRTVVVQAPEAEALSLRLTDADGALWTAEVTLDAGAQLDLDLRVAEGGRLVVYTPTSGAAGPSGPGNQVPGRAPLDGVVGRTLAWAAGAAGWLLALLLLWRQPLELRSPRAVPGRAAPLGSRALTQLRCGEGEQAALLERLSVGHRVVWVGALPAASAEGGPLEGLPEGSVFLAPQSAGGLLSLVRQLRGRGRPLVVVLAAPPLELDGEGAPESMARALGGVPLVVLTPDGDHQLLADGRLVAL